MFFLHIYLKPFSEPILNYTNVGSEFGMCLFIIMASSYLFDLSDLSKNNVDLCLMVLLNSVAGLQMIGSILILLKTIRNKIRAKRKKNRVDQVAIKFEVVLNDANADRSEEIHGGALMNSPISSAQNNSLFDGSCNNSAKSNQYLGIS